MSQMYVEGRGFGRGPRVVYVTNQLPWPAHSGGQVREAELLARVGDSADVEMFVLTQHFRRDALNSRFAADHCASVHIFQSDTRPDDTTPAPLDIPERSWSYQSSRFDAQLATHLREHDVDLIHVEGFFLLAHLPEDLDVPISLTEENIEYQLDREHDEAGTLRGASWQHTRELERAAWARASRVLSVTAADADVIREAIGSDRVGVSRNGFDHLKRPQSPLSCEGQRAAFVGNYSWAPTRDAAWELVRDIWPRVASLLAEARLSLVGAGLGDELRAAANACPSIDVVGEVDSVLPMLRDSDVFLCPTRMGSGVKMKMIEALHVGCAVVCTDGALRGLPECVREAVLVADDPQSLANATVRLLKNPSLREDLAERARTAISELPSWDQAAKTLLDEWHLAIAVPRTAR